MVKKLEPKSEFEVLDIDGDGVVSDQELSAVESLVAHDKQYHQSRLSYCAMIAMLTLTMIAVLPVLSMEKLKILDGLFSIFFITMGGIIAAYFGAQAFVQRGKK